VGIAYKIIQSTHI